MAPKYISEAEVSQITGRALPTLRKDRHYQRGIPYYRVGRQIRYRVEDIEKFMAGCRVEVKKP
jgi:hypothetical protein